MVDFEKNPSGKPGWGVGGVINFGCFSFPSSRNVTHSLGVPQ